MSKRVRTLLRVSSRQQLHDDDIPIQRAETEQFISKHPDWVFDKEYLEKGISAYHNGVEDREVLQEIMQDAREKQFDVLLAYMSDRIGRQEEYSFYVAELNRLGIEVWTIKDGQLKTEEHIDKLLNYIRFWQNEGESKKTGMRVHDTMVEMVKAGRFIGGKAPYGYKLVLSGEISNHGRALHKLEIDSAQAEVVRKIYGYAVNQGMGYQKIANQLNEEGIHAPTLDQWKNGSVRSILTNPIYMGYVAYDRRRACNGNYTSFNRTEWIYANEKNPEIEIISQQIWERAQEIRESRKAKINGSRQKSNEMYMEQNAIPFTTRGKLALTGFVYCGYCGTKLRNESYANHWTSKRTGEEKVSFVGRYGCGNHCKPRAHYTQRYLESIVFSAIEEYLSKLRSIDVTSELLELQSQNEKVFARELRELESERKRLDTDIELLYEKITDALRGESVFSEKKLAELIEKKEQQKLELDKRKISLENQIKQSTIQKEEIEAFISQMPNWDQLFRDSDVQTKKMILSTLIDQILVKDDEITIRFKIQLEKYMDKKLPETVHSPTTP